MKLVFSSIINKSIFESDFRNLAPDVGTIEFKQFPNSQGGLAVVYAPNGTGKSSFARVLEVATSKDISFSATDDNGSGITSNSFHVIHDQMNRNVIQGKETDYLIGKQIKREYELRDKINSAFDAAFSSLSARIKNEYKVAKVSDYLLSRIEKLQEPFSLAFPYLRSIINNKSHGKDIDRTKFVSFICNDANKPNLCKLDEEKRSWLIADCGKAGIAERIINLDCTTIVANHEILQIEQHDDAIEVLKKYHSLESCVVCDNHDFDGDELLASKQANRKRIYDNLDQKTKELLDNVITDSSLEVSDPFEIKRIASDLLCGKNETEFIKLQEGLKHYIDAIDIEMISLMVHCFDGTSLLSDFDEYNGLLSTQPVLDNEELLFIEEVINENIGKEITIKRDPSSRNYKLKLGDKDLIGANCGALELSLGEQNFISLAFELLLARHSNKEYIILDDPISSFDSVYKNKIAFCIIKFLDEKKQIVLTHNIDLVRLLNVQLYDCFNLYILNNVESGNNGFIPVSPQEKALLIDLHELVNLFQNKGREDRGDCTLVSAIKNKRQFLMSMIPFLRGYAHISLDKYNDYGTLSNIMHGYITGSVDVALIYKRLFDYDFGEEMISVSDILSLDCGTIDILDSGKFPLLASTLRLTLVYYHLRMKVEKELVEAFSINTNKGPMLNQIINRAFPKSKDIDEQNKRFRVFFTSRKTLLNEFNHFEGNMNIFQPAMDVSEAALKKEISDIEGMLIKVKRFANGSN